MSAIFILRQRILPKVTHFLRAAPTLFFFTSGGYKRHFAFRAESNFFSYKKSILKKESLFSHQGVFETFLRIFPSKVVCSTTTKS